MTTVWCEADMWRKRLFSGFLVALLLVQYTVSVPTPSLDGRNSSTTEFEHSTIQSTVQDDAELPGRKMLAYFAQTNHSLIYSFELERSFEIAKAVLADPAISDVDTEGMISERNQLEKYVKSVKDAAEETLPQGKTDIETRFNILIVKGGTLKHFEGFAYFRNASHVPDMTDTKRVVWQALLRHGLDDYQKEAAKRWETFHLQFADDVLQYVNSLSPDERQKEKQLVEYCEGYQQHSDEMTKEKFGSKIGHAFIIPNWDRKRG